MSYNAKERVIGWTDKGRDEAIRVAVVEGKNGLYSLDVRVFYDMDAEPLPTKKGIRVNNECVVELMANMADGLECQEFEELMDKLHAIADERFPDEYEDDES